MPQRSRLRPSFTPPPSPPPPSRRRCRWLISGTSTCSTCVRATAAAAAAATAFVALTSVSSVSAAPLGSRSSTTGTSMHLPIMRTISDNTMEAYNMAEELMMSGKDLFTFCEDSVLADLRNSTGNVNATLSDNGSSNAILKCIAKYLQNDFGSRSFARSVLLVDAAAMVFFMQAGFAMLCAGAVRKKNVQNTMLKNLLDACGASIAFFTVGYAFAFGGMELKSPTKTFVGNTNFFLMDVDDLAFWLFQYAFSAASTTIVAGTLAERCQMVAYLCYSMMLSGWVYPIVVHAIWNTQGFLSANSIEPLWGVGVVDFAGSGVVHVTGGVTALFATMILGPRRGRFHDEAGRRLEVPREFPGHSIALQMLGTFILWFGWYGFNCGSALLFSSPQSAEVASIAGVNTTLSGGAACLTALLVNLWWLERYTGEPFFDLKMAMNGCLSGLVAITGGCGVIEPWAAVATGIVAGNLYLISTRALVWLRLDDAVDAIPVHLINGSWGLIAAGLFASPRRLLAAYGRNDHPGLFYALARGQSPTLLGAQFVGLLFIIGWVMCIMLPFFIWLDWQGWLRSDPLEEIVGLDTSYHGGLALMGGNDDINPEYLSAYKKKREQENSLRRRTNAAAVSAAAANGGAPRANGIAPFAASTYNDPFQQETVIGSSDGHQRGGGDEEDDDDDEERASQKSH